MQANRVMKEQTRAFVERQHSSFFLVGGGYSVMRESKAEECIILNRLIEV